MSDNRPHFGSRATVRSLGLPWVRSLANSLDTRLAWRYRLRLRIGTSWIGRAIHRIADLRFRYMRCRTTERRVEYHRSISIHMNTGRQYWFIAQHRVRPTVPLLRAARGCPISLHPRVHCSTVIAPFHQLYTGKGWDPLKQPGRQIDRYVDRAFGLGTHLDSLEG